MMGDADITCTVHHTRHRSEQGEEAHVGAVGDAFDKGLAPGYLRVRFENCLADGRVNRSLSGRKLAAKPFHFRPMLS